MSEYYKIEEICKVKGGKRIPQGCTLQEIPNEHPYIRILDMYQGRILNISEEMQYVREEYWNIIKNYIVKKGDVILAIVGNTLGMVSVIGDTLDGANLTENCCKFNDLDTDKVRKLFLYYSLIAPLNQKNIEKFKVGSSQPKLPIYNINQLLVPKWSIDVQDKIVNTLSSIDSKIENNNKINQELESMSKTIYDYWFLQFEFPNEDGKPYKSSGGKMVWNEELKREIPEEWGSITIGEITNCLDYKRIPLSRQERKLKIGNIPYYGATGIMDYVDEAIFDGEYVLVAEDGSIMDEKGHPILQRVSGRVWINNHAHVLQPSKSHSCKLLMMLLKDVSVMKIKTGSIQMKINQANLNKTSVLNIPEKLIIKINEKLEIIDSKILHLVNENQELISLRDFLLPLLMNGQVGFKD
ncbi:MAG: restriction endonuclease subunit S [Lachnospiraceae bacterium]|nr:restriction endonuclease subunit S [Lachnospiraceae bacterium]MCI9106456.1 restriction endonuclease subunit S [Lachnospiraceae bacterium]